MSLKLSPLNNSFYIQAVAKRWGTITSWTELYSCLYWGHFTSVLKLTLDLRLYRQSKKFQKHFWICSSTFRASYWDHRVWYSTPLVAIFIWSMLRLSVGLLSTVITVLFAHFEQSGISLDPLGWFHFVTPQIISGIN